MSVSIFNPGKTRAIGLIPRAARVSLRLPLVFSSAEGRVSGHSVNVSESGVLGVFQGNIEVWLTGQLTIVVPERRRIQVQVRIVRVDGRNVALSFMALAPSDRLLLRQLIAVAERRADAASGWTP